MAGCVIIIIEASHCIGMYGACVLATGVWRCTWGCGWSCQRLLSCVICCWYICGCVLGGMCPRVYEGVHVMV